MKKTIKKVAKNSFAEKVRRVVARIPKGKVMTYKQVAEKAGFPGAARAVGTLMKGNYDPLIPCHRVVRTDGSVGEYNRGGRKQKIAILEKEGVPLKNGKVVLR